MKPLQIFATFVLAAMLMLVMRMVVKTLYDVTSANSQAMRVLIYGALTGGAGVAKYIRSENPARFELRGFLTHEKRIKGMQMLDPGGADQPAAGGRVPREPEGPGHPDRRRLQDLHVPASEGSERQERCPER